MIPKEFWPEVKDFSYAVFKVADEIGNEYLKNRIQVKAIDLMEAGLDEDKLFLNTLKAVESLVEFGFRVGEITEQNQRALKDKIYDFEHLFLPEIKSFEVNSVLNLNNSEDEEDFDFLEEESEEDGSSENFSYDEEISEQDDVWSGEDDISLNGLNSNNEKTKDNEKEVMGVDDLSSEKISSEKNDEEGDENSRTKADERREKILDKVRQGGICFLKDLAEMFPDYSERTLRYDLEKLIADNKVEKIGSSGPGTFYRSI